ncbi:MAG: hypothetical protein K1W02_01005 [Muribaculaceae bacterium]
MKAIIATGNRIDSSKGLSWYFIADSCMANAGKPFFIPDFADSFDAVIAPVVRISRLGKSIASKFAPRYYQEIAPAIHFQATDLYDSLLQEGRSPDMALNFDRSIIIGNFMKAEDFLSSAPLELVKNGETVAEWTPSMFSSGIDDVIEAVSATNTLKTGDLIVPGISVPTVIAPGDRIELRLNGEKLLLVAIK